MKTHLSLIATCLLLAGCQAQRAKFSSFWSPTEVVDSVAESEGLPYDTSELPTHANTPRPDPNKLLTLTDVSGNQEFLYLDSITQERGVINALIEFRYVKPQTLPANGMTYHYNQWREQIDCQHKVRILRNTTHYNDAGDIVDSIDYPVPKYKPAELAALAQPNDKVIQTICQRVGEQTPPEPVVVQPPAVNASEAAPTTEPIDQNEKTTQSKKKDKKGHKKETSVPVEMKTDFISKGKAEEAQKNADTAPPPAQSETASPKPETTPEAKPSDTPAAPETDKKTKKDKRKGKNKKQHEATSESPKTAANQEKADQDKKVELIEPPPKKSTVSPLETGEIPLVPTNLDD